MKECIVYLRKSQFDKDYENLSVGETLKRHEDRLNEFIAHTDYVVTDTLKEVVSGESLSARPQMLKLLDMVNSHQYYGVICVDIDRLSRGNSVDSGYIMQVLKLNNCKIITPAKTYDLNNDSDEQFTDFKFLFSRYELSTIRKRLQVGIVKSVQDGKYATGRAPYGYRREKLKGDKGYKLIIEPFEAEVVRKIFDLYVNKGLGYHAVTDYINNTGVANVSYGLVKHILINPVYTGVIAFGTQKTVRKIENGKVIKKTKYNCKDVQLYDGLHDAIIEKELFDKAVTIREKRAHPSVNIHHQISNPFAGILFCAQCGKRIVRHEPAKYQNTSPLYKCINKQCDCRSTRCDILDNAILNELEKWLKDYEVTIQQKSDDTDYDLLLTEYGKQLNDLKNKQTKLCEFLESGIYTVDMFKSRNESITNQIDTINAQILHLNEHRATIQRSDDIIPCAQKILANFSNVNGYTKNQLLKQVLHHATYYRKRGSDDIEIKLYPLL